MFIMYACLLLYFTCNTIFCMYPENESLHQDEAIAQKAKDAFLSFINIINPQLCIPIEGEPFAVTNNPYKEQQAHVRYGGCISEGERAYMQKRLPIVRAALEKALNRSLEDQYIPTIALIASGGGYRSMLCTTGSLAGAQKIGLLDTISYTSTLSGSTWAIAPLISTKLTLKKFKEYLIECASRGFFDLTEQECELISDAIGVKKIYQQECTIVDYYGALLANRLLDFFESRKEMVYLSDQASIIADGSRPYPIYTAVDARTLVNPSWYTFTPHEIGNIHEHSYVPSWAYGRTFNNGTSTNNAPEQHIGYHLGTWGSAFGASLYDGAEEIASHISSAQKIIEGIKPIGGLRLPCYAKVPNYMTTQNAQTQTQEQQQTIKKNIKLVDAGTDFNLPYPPVSGLCSERKADVLIFLDNSAGQLGKEFEKVVAFAQRNNIPFPVIDFYTISKQTISIFKDENNPQAPVVIYMPCISDKALWETYRTQDGFKKYFLDNFDLEDATNNGFASTIHFSYTPENATKVIHQTEFNIRANKDAIFDAINWKIDHHA